MVRVFQPLTIVAVKTPNSSFLSDSFAFSLFKLIAKSISALEIMSAYFIKRSLAQIKRDQSIALQKSAAQPVASFCFNFWKKEIEGTGKDSVQISVGAAKIKKELGILRGLFLLGFVVNMKCKEEICQQ